MGSPVLDFHTLVTFGFTFGLLRRAPEAQHAPEDHVGQGHEPAQSHVARRRPVADDEGPQDEEVDVGPSHEGLPRPRREMRAFGPDVAPGALMRP